MIQTVLAGALGLCLLEVVLTSTAATDRIGDAGAGLGSALGRVIDPYVPLIGAAPAVTPGSAAAAGTQVNEGGGEGPAADHTAPAPAATAATAPAAPAPAVTVPPGDTLA